MKQARRRGSWQRMIPCREGHGAGRVTSVRAALPRQGTFIALDARRPRRRDGAAPIGPQRHPECEGKSACGTTDKDLAAEISKRLAAFSGPDRWAVSVQAGVADIEDHVDSAEDRIVAETLVAAVPGVVHAQARYLTSDPF